MESSTALGSHWEISFEFKKRLYEALAKKFKKMYKWKKGKILG